MQSAARKPPSRWTRFADPIRPPVIWKMCSWLCANAASLEGIFRVPGAQNAIQAVRATFTSDGATFEGIADLTPQAVAGALTSYLRERPEPLIPFDSYRAFVEAMKVFAKTGDLAPLKEEVEDLPRENKACLQAVVHLLAQVHKNVGATKMGAGNLGLVFGPTLMREEVENVLSTDSCDVVSTLIEHYEDAFPDPLAELPDFRCGARIPPLRSLWSVSGAEAHVVWFDTFQGVKEARAVVKDVEDSAASLLSLVEASPTAGSAATPVVPAASPVLQAAPDEASLAISDRTSMSSIRSMSPSLAPLPLSPRSALGAGGPDAERLRAQLARSHCAMSVLVSRLVAALHRNIVLEAELAAARIGAPDPTDPDPAAAPDQQQQQAGAAAAAAAAAAATAQPALPEGTRIPGAALLPVVAQVQADLGEAVNSLDCAVPALLSARAVVDKAAGALGSLAGSAATPAQRKPLEDSRQMLVAVSEVLAESAEQTRDEIDGMRAFVSQEVGKISRGVANLAAGLPALDPFPHVSAPAPSGGRIAFASFSGRGHSASSSSTVDYHISRGKAAEAPDGRAPADDAAHGAASKAIGIGRLAPGHPATRLGSGSISIRSGAPAAPAAPAHK